MNIKVVLLAVFAIGWYFFESAIVGIALVAIVFFKFYLPAVLYSWAQKNRIDWGAKFEERKRQRAARKEHAAIVSILHQRGKTEPVQQSKEPRPRRAKPTQHKVQPPRSSLPDNRRPVIQRSRFGW